MTTALDQLREVWRSTNEHQSQDLLAAYCWVGNPAEAWNTETLVAAIREVADTYPAEEWQSVTISGQRALMADLLTSDTNAEELARRVLVSYRQGESSGRLVRYVGALVAMMRPAVGTVVALVMVDAKTGKVTR